MVAAEEGYTETVQFLINAGATVNDKSNYVCIINAFDFSLNLSFLFQENSALTLACRNQYISIAVLIAAGAEVHIFNHCHTHQCFNTCDVL